MKMFAKIQAGPTKGVTLILAGAGNGEKILLSTPARPAIKHKGTGYGYLKRKFQNKSYCMLEPAIIESQAFEDLSGKAAMLVLIRFHQKAYKKRRDGKKRGLKELVVTNNGEIIFTYGEAKELGIKSTQTFFRVLKELIEEKGFIDVNYRGGYYHNDPSKYSISGRWKRYGTPDYERIEIPRILPKGIGFKKQN